MEGNSLKKTDIINPSKGFPVKRVGRSVSNIILVGEIRGYDMVVH